MTTLNNKLFLLGHVGQDPEIRVLDSGRKMAKFSLATNEIYLNSLGEKVEKAYWHKIVFWNRAAEVVAVIAGGQRADDLAVTIDRLIVEQQRLRVVQPQLDQPA